LGALVMLVSDRITWANCATVFRSKGLPQNNVYYTGSICAMLGA
jgi:hypothetical protein